MSFSSISGYLYDYTFWLVGGISSAAHAAARTAEEIGGVAAGALSNIASYFTGIWNGPSQIEGQRLLDNRQFEIRVVTIREGESSAFLRSQTSSRMFLNNPALETGSLIERSNPFVAIKNLLVNLTQEQQQTFNAFLKRLSGAIASDDPVTRAQMISDVEGVAEMLVDLEQKETYLREKDAAWNEVLCGSNESGKRVVLYLQRLNAMRLCRVFVLGVKKR